RGTANMKPEENLLKRFNTVNEAELGSIRTSIEGGNPLSGYIGSSTKPGTFCDHLETQWALTFGSKHAIAVNSATSGLLAAGMAIELMPGDEVIVSPYTM